MFDGKPTFPSLFEGEIDDSKVQEENQTNGEDGSDCDDLPASGICKLKAIKSFKSKFDHHGPLETLLSYCIHNMKNLASVDQCISNH